MACSRLMGQCTVKWDGTGGSDKLIGSLEEAGEGGESGEAVREGGGLFQALQDCTRYTITDWLMAVQGLLHTWQCRHSQHVIIQNFTYQEESPARSLVCLHSNDGGAYLVRRALGASACAA